LLQCCLRRQQKEPNRADIEGAQSSENLDGMRAGQAGSQAIDSADAQNYGKAQAAREGIRLSDCPETGMWEVWI
jgi:hypothetical protein